jgi:hypothetical protein
VRRTENQEMQNEQAMIYGVFQETPGGKVYASLCWNKFSLHTVRGMVVAEVLEEGKGR